MKKQLSKGMKIEDDFTSATKKLIKKTLIGLAIAIIIVLFLAVWAFKKITSPKRTAENSPEPSAQVLSTTAEPLFSPSESPLTSSSPSTPPTPSLSPSPSSSPSSSPTSTPSSTPTTSPTPISNSTPSPSTSSAKTINSQANLDGWQAGNGTGSATAEIKVGRNNSAITRGFISFDITSLGQNINNSKIKLRMYQQGIVGAPYISGGELKIDHLNFGSSFDNSDFSTSSISSSFATLSTNSTPGWKEIEVTQNVKGDLAAGRSRSQFRIHFSVEQTGGGANGEYVLIESGDNALKSGNIPQLIIQ